MKEQDKFLNDMQKAAFLYFWEQTNTTTGQVKDRGWTNGTNDVNNNPVASIAATGYSLASLAIAAERGYVSRVEAEKRVLVTLRFIKNNLENVHGFYYHFVNMNTGKREWTSELSSIDTAIMLCGVLTAKQYFIANSEIKQLSDDLYKNVDWKWMQNGQESLSMGWNPETGFLAARWNSYCELMMLYLLGVGSPNPAFKLSPTTWNAFTRPTITFQNFTYVNTNAPLFTHQYSHAFFDFRDRKDKYKINYFDNSVTATKAHKAFCISLQARFPSYTDQMWGISASDSESGYQAWGGPPEMGRLDGSIVPCACGGSVVFDEECVDVLIKAKEQYPQSYSKYSFRDAFNPLTGWYDDESLGIDLGITLLQTENYRTGFVWKWFMKNPEVVKAMKEVGFVSTQSNWWVWLLVAIAACLLAVGGYFVVRQMKKKQQGYGEIEELRKDANI